MKSMLRRFGFLGLGFTAALTLGTGCSSDSGGGNDMRGGFGDAGVGGSGGGGGLLTDSGTQTTGIFAGCASDTYGSELKPVDMYIMMDRSGSMGDSTTGASSVWNAVKTAITEFVNAPESAGIGVGIQFFPVDQVIDCGIPPNCINGCVPFPPTLPGGPPPLLCIPLTGGSCDVNDYLPPAVNIAPLPGVAQDIINAMNNTQPGGGTPTLPAMQSAVQATTGLAMSNSGRKVVIVLATDGDPNDCNSTVQGVADVAATAASAVPSVETFVIGLGNVSGLDQIAQAGGTNEAIIVNTSNASQDFLDALNVVRGAIACNLAIPSPPSGENPDPNQLNVAFFPDGTEADVFPRRDDASQCAGERGWYYDNNDAPTQISLCPASCDQATNVEGQLQVAIGCEEQIR